MADAEILDLLSLDRDVSRAVAQVERWRSGLIDDPQRRAEDDPFDGVRRVSAKSTRDALLAYDVSGEQRALRDALVRWTAALVETRLDLTDEVAFAVEASAPRARFEGEGARLVSWREAWRRLVAARGVAEARLWLDAAAEAAPPVAAVTRRRASRRMEVARRLGDQHPWALQLSAPPEAIRSAACRLLDATDPIAAALHQEAPRDARGPAAAILDAMARDAGDGWPARLSSGWLEQTFTGFARGLPIRIGRLPKAWGAASFARALHEFGFASRVASAPTSMPFALAHDPAFVGAHRWGFLFGSLAADPDFQQRILGVTRRTALAQARRLSRTALLDVRLHAARIILSALNGPRPEPFEEVGTRLFGQPLDVRLRGAWPHAREDEPARLVGLLQTPALRHALIDRFDVDWYRNPRAWTHLRAEGSLPAWEPIDDTPLDQAADALGRSFEEALG